MDRQMFKIARHILSQTQVSFSKLLGVSLKAVQSYEQGYRQIPVHIERKVYFFLSQSRTLSSNTKKNCWDRKKCKSKHDCPAWEFNAGKFCWFFGGTNCFEGNKNNIHKIMSNCRNCDVVKQLYNSD